MKIEYRRTAKGSYMLLEGSEMPVGYEREMLTKNDVPHLLDFHTIKLNGNTQFWYDISGMRSFKDIIKAQGISLELLQDLFTAMEEAQSAIAKYLIRQENILMCPDALFFEKRGTLYYAGLCFCATDHDDLEDQLRELTGLLISEVDHSKSDITGLCYELNAISEREEFSFYDLINCIKERYKGAEEDILTEDDTMNRLCRMGADPWEEFSGEKSTVEPIAEPTVEEDPKVSVRFSLKEKIKGLLPKLILPKSRLLPEKKEFQDIEFDEVVQREEGTVLLSHDSLGASGKLMYESGGRGGSDIELVKSPFSIGSRPNGNDAVLSSDAVSRYHARITRHDGGYFIEDLNSKNGTYVNGEILAYQKPQKLNRLDVVAFADMVYRVV